MLLKGMGSLQSGDSFFRKGKVRPPFDVRHGSGRDTNQVTQRKSQLTDVLTCSDRWSNAVFHKLSSAKGCQGFRETKTRNGGPTFVRKVKCSRDRPGVAQRVGRGIALLFHDRGTRRG